ncbi:MAG: VWA domain-containing protein [Planctomycetaceae bacterium]|jgi:uncharacterized membrane protein|nr:VWA domain-containing protein [Planctomycetaceae bacterium]
MQLEFEQPLCLFGLLLLAVIFLGYRQSLVDFSRRQRKISLCVRSLILVLLVLALAGLTILKASNKQRLIFVTDMSRSVEDKCVIKSKEYHGAAAETSFGTANETNIAEGIEKALSLVPPEYVPHLVLFSDGNDTTKAEIAAILSGCVSSGRTAIISAIPVSGSDAPEIQLAEVKSPNSSVREGEPFTLDAVVQSNTKTNALVMLYRDAFKIAEVRKQLQAGENSVRFNLTATDKKQQEYTVEVRPPDAGSDTIAENNRLQVVVAAEGKPRVLILDNEPATMRDFAAALKEQDIAADIRPPEAMTGTLQLLDQYDAVILGDVPATAFSLQQMNLFRQYVSELGGGLMMLGGDQSFGLGGYYKTPIEEILPVRCDLPKEKEKPSIAMCLVIDRSGSMGGQKMEWAKDAAKAAVELLTPKDFVAVIAFDNESYLVSPMQSAAAVSSINAAISSIEPAGGTNIYPALAEAFEQLRKTPAKLKHVILLTDGQSAPGDFEGIVRQMTSELITASMVGVGEADNELLKRLADIGRGRHYACNDPQAIPQIFVKETIAASQSALHEEPFVPIVVSPAQVLDGIDIDSAPPLLGYVAVQNKAAVRFVLAAGGSDPLLVFHRYGLGTAAVFTSDTKSRWAAEWLAWQPFGKFWAQIIRSIMRQNSSAGLRGVTMTLTKSGKSVHIAVDAVDAAEQFMNGTEVEVTKTDNHILPGTAQRSSPVVLHQTAPGHYCTDISDDAGSLLTVSLKSAGKVLWRESRGLTQDYPLELRIQPANETLLKSLADSTGGLYNPLPEDLAKFKTDKTVQQPLPLRNYLLALAAFLFVLDVFLRRVSLKESGKE